MRFFGTLPILLHLLGCQGMVLNITSNNQNISENTTVEDNTDWTKWLAPLRGPDDRFNALTTGPEVVDPSTALEDQVDAPTLQTLDRPQDRVTGSEEDVAWSIVIRTPEDNHTKPTKPEYYYELLCFVLVFGACVYAAVMFLELVKHLKRQNHAQPIPQLPEPQQAPVSFQDLIKRDDHHPCSILP